MKKLFSLLAVMLLTVSIANAQDKKSTSDKIVDGAVTTVKETGKKTKKAKKAVADGIESLTGDSSNKTVNRIGEELIDRIDRKAANIIGTWAYKEPAIDYNGGNILKEAASLAAENKLEKKMGKYYTDLGFNEKSFRVTFSTNKRFSIVFNNKEVGKGRYFVDGTDVFLEFEGHENLGKLDPYEREDGLDVLMLPGRMKTVMSNIGCSTDGLEALSEILKVLSGVEIGMHMVKVK